MFCFRPSSPLPDLFLFFSILFFPPSSASRFNPPHKMVAGWKRPGAPRFFLRRLSGSGGRSPPAPPPARPLQRCPIPSRPRLGSAGRPSPPLPGGSLAGVPCAGARLLSAPPVGMARFWGTGESSHIFILPPSSTKKRALGFSSPFARQCSESGRAQPGCSPGAGDGERGAALAGSRAPHLAHRPSAKAASALGCFGFLDVLCHFERSQRAEQSPQLGCWDPSHPPSAPSPVAGWRV